MTGIKPFVLYSVSDSALDDVTMGTDLTKYARYRDPDLVKIKHGELPTVFHCVDIHTSVYNAYVSAATTDAERYQRCFEVGVAKVENLVQKDGTHRAMVTPSETIKTITGTVPRWSVDEINLFWPAYTAEIGCVLDIRCGVPLGLGQTYPVARLSLHALLARMQFLAASIPDAPGLTNDDNREAQETASESDGGEDIGAPVMESPTGFQGGKETASPTA